jgi:hypothetical protein
MPGDIYDCSPANAQGSVSNDVKDFMNNTKGLVSYILSIGIHIFIIYFGINYFTKVLTISVNRADCVPRLNLIVLLFMIFILLFNIIFYNIGSNFKIFYFKMFGLSGIGISVISAIMYMIFKKFNIENLVNILRLDWRPFIISGMILLILGVLLMIVIGSIKKDALHKKKRNKYLSLLILFGINYIILYLIISGLILPCKQ